ncbi:MAG: histidine--tRNA ligase [Candidatus Paceibacterota bacterium]
MTDKKQKIETEPYKGVRDFYPQDMAIENYIFNVWRKTAESFGYVEYNASILEPTELYKSKTSEEIVNEQTYSFVDRGDRGVTLRPEMTPTAARMIAAKRRETAFPLRWYSIANVFRYERPQHGRLREHFQLNADFFGFEKELADVEIISLAYTIMKNFGASDDDFEIQINSRKLTNAILDNFYELDEEKSKAIRQLIDRKEKINNFEEEAEKIVGRPFEFLGDDYKSEKWQEALSNPMIREAKEELDKTIETLKDRGIANVKYSETLMRGFEYYTGVVFEIFDTNPKNNRALFGGGRFDELMENFDAEKVGAVGFGMGDVTIKDFLEIRGLIPDYKPTIDLCICPLNNELIENSEKLGKVFRENDVRVIVDISGKKVSEQLKTANRQNIPYVIVVGDTEINEQKFKVKEMKTGKETEFDFKDVKKAANLILSNTK